MVSLVIQTYTNLELISMYTYISLCDRIQIDRLQAGYVERGEANLIPIITFQNMVADRSNITDHYQNRLSCKYDDHKFLKMNMLYS